MSIGGADTDATTSVASATGAFEDALVQVGDEMVALGVAVPFAGSGTNKPEVGLRTQNN
jgi:hypothetical protein